MLSKKIKTIITKVIVGLVLVCSLVLSSGMKMNTYKVNATPIERQEIRVNNECHGIKGKILIYHSHTNEKNKDMSIVEMGNDLTKKLEKKGYKVEHITEDFTRNGYNNAYHSSRKMLESKDLKSYDLIIDLHMNGGVGENATKDIKDQQVNKVMFVNTKNNPNKQLQDNITSNIGATLNSFGNKISEGNVALYYKGIIHYNEDLSNNIILIEQGNDQSNELSTRRTNTYLVSAIDKYIINKNNK